nr:unnamed protein product [Callosobruchus analis]
MKLKKKAKKMVADIQTSIACTGGGPRQVEIFDPVIEAILEVINRKTVVGLYSPWDSVAQIIVKLERIEVGILDQDANVSEQSKTIQEIEDISDQLPSCSLIIIKYRPLILMKMKYKVIVAN